MRRIITGVVTAALAVSLLALPASAVEFTDIQGHWGQTSMEQVAEWGLFTGTGNQQFSPDGTMTRGMFVTVMERTAKLLEVYKEPTGTATFTDVPADTWYTQAVVWANENNVVNGVGGDKFAPDDPVTREQMCVIMARFLENCVGMDLTAYKESEMTFLDQSEISDFAVESVKVCVALGLITGAPAEGGMKFQPQEPASRAAVAVVLERQVKVCQGEVPEQPGGETGQPGGETGGQPGGGGEGSGQVPPVEEPSEEEKAEEAKVAEYLQIMLDAYHNSAYLPTTDKEVQDCMAILMNCIEDALAQRDKGQFLDRAYVQERYADQISELQKAYDSLTEDQLNQINNVIVRLADSDQIYFVMDYFGVSMGT